jgi:hypothetical protein
VFEKVLKTARWAAHFQKVSPQNFVGCQYAAAVVEGCCPAKTQVRCEQPGKPSEVWTLAHCQQCTEKVAV